jgi:outer membrane protein TolC
MISALGEKRSALVIYIGLILHLTSELVCAQTVRLDIAKALQLSIQNSDQLKYARLDHSFQISRYRLSLREYLPDVTLGYAQDDAVVYYQPDNHLKRLSVGLEQLVFAGGARSNARRSMINGLRTGELKISRAEKALRLDVMSRFVEMLNLALQTDILGESLAAAREQARIAREELKLGEITQLDYIDIELAVQDLEIEAAILAQEEEGSMFELKELLCVSPTVCLELIGEIDPEFRGMLPELDARYYVESALNNSVELSEQNAELMLLGRGVRQARYSWLPRISTQMEWSVTGERFPLTEPGFSLGVNLDFSTPLLPLSTGLTTGRRGENARSLGLGASADLAGNLQELQSRATARTRLQELQTEVDRMRRSLEHSILRELDRRSFMLNTLLLEEKRLKLSSRRIAIQELMLEIGEITRLEYLQSRIEFTRQQMEQLSRAVKLFQLEAEMLARCGMEILERSHRFILIADSEEKR